VQSDYAIRVPFAVASGADLPPEALGVAIDIGTTTVALMLVELATGESLARASAFNRQMHFGDDVVTRITLCAADAAATHDLQKAICLTIADLVAEALSTAARPRHAIARVTVAGNTTMLHLLAGENPTTLGMAPFTAVFLEPRTMPAIMLPHCLGVDPQCPVQLLPSTSAYIGADIVAGVLATGLAYDQDVTLLVDVGTNGEIVLHQCDALIGCATAAGPAFEGAGLTSGIRAGHGAISYLKLGMNPFVVTSTIIGNAAVPIGLCGSAYIDFLAEAARVGLVEPTGRYAAALHDGAAAALTRDRCGTKGLRLALGPGHEPLMVSEGDIAKLLTAKAAVAAGILTLLQREGLTPADVARVYLAGGFGTHMNAANAIACGLLPGFTPGQIIAVGNTSLAGAYLALIDVGIMPELTRIAQAITAVELNTDPAFEGLYIDQLTL
jgi:uncharacterized 2Fe-2S/4Fe-4S cluster protein (DUF4445 family)